MASVWAELKRRNVVRVGVAYVVLAWLLLQVSDTLVPALNLPGWIQSAVALLLILGLPIALFFAWTFELASRGVRRDSGENRSESASHIERRKLDFAIWGLMAVAIVYLLADRFFLIEPSPELDNRTAVIPADTQVSIAVLPFKNRSAADGDAYFVDGIHDDILTQLAKLSSIDKVISRTSVEQYRGTDKSLPQIGRELGVVTILEGGVQRAGDRVRITVQLIDAATDEHRWAESYDRQLTVDNIFAIQSEIARAVVDQLEASLFSYGRDNIAAMPTANMEALENYFKGNEQLDKRTTSSLEAAAAYYQAAVDLDPNFASAYLGLASAHTMLITYAGMPWREQIAKARPLVSKALELDDGLRRIPCWVG